MEGITDRLYFGQHAAAYNLIKKNDDDIEYVRKDAFIKKACKWLKSNITNNPNANSVLARNGCVTLGMLIEDFKKYMEE